MAGRNEKNKSTWFLTALAVPVMQAASGCSWPAACALGILTLGVCEGVEALGVPEIGWLQGIGWLWLTVVLSSTLGWTLHCWPSNSPAIPGALLLLAAWAASGGEDKAMRAGNLLRFFILALLGAVLLSGVWDIRMENLRPDWRVDNASLLTTLLLCGGGTGMGSKGLGVKSALFLLAVTVSVVVTGVLSGSFASAQASALFELSKSVRLLGVAERFESLAAVGMTLGYYVFACWCLTLCGNWAKTATKAKGTWPVWTTAGAAFAGLFLKWQNYGMILAIGTLIVFIVLPLICTLIGKWGKRN